MTSSFAHAYVINVMADDHPGIVSSVSSVIESLSGNIDGCSQTVLGGYFTLIMLVSLPEPIESDVLSEMIRQVNTDFQVSVRHMRSKSAPAAHQDSDSYVITVFGKDKPAIVRKFSAYLADREINIVDLYGAHRGEDEFVLIGQVEVPTHWNLDTLQSELAYMGKELGFTVKLQQQNIFLATNQLRLPKN
ncbi:MAG: hypothetical protein IJQ39_01165 [Thermoguttaceae bacterium]|nr:hypothetical protein [Thermoguttaceae bacterium]